jgi:hypothetical protein
MTNQKSLASFVGHISRPKLTGLGTHSGVLLQDGNVAHMTTEGSSIVTLEKFAEGRPVRAEKAAPPSTYRQLQWRAHQATGRTRPYELLNRNCEHYASYLMGQKPDSPQVTAVLVLSALGVLLLAAQ